MKLELLYIADLIALKQELHERILTCYNDIASKKKKGLPFEHLHQMSLDYTQKFDAVKAELERRIAIIEF